MTYRKKVIGIIFNKDKEVLIWKYNGKLWSKWFGYNTRINRTFPGGWKEGWEHFHDALLREIYEEVGLNTDHLNIIYKYKRFYFYKYKSKQKTRLHEQRWRNYKGKKQRIYILYFNGEKSEINTEITSEFSKTKRIHIEEIPNYLHTKLVRFIKLDSVKHIINEHSKKI